MEAAGLGVGFERRGRSVPVRTRHQFDRRDGSSDERRERRSVRVVSRRRTGATSVIEAGGKVCLEGQTVVDPKFGAWGAAVSFDFYNLGEGKQAYDALGRGIGGFEVTISGSFPQGLRIQFAAAVQSEGESPPFVPVARPGTYRVRLADAFVPIQWDAKNAGAEVDPTKLGSFQVQIVGGEVSGPFAFCVDSVIPLPSEDDGALGAKPVSFVPIPLPETSWVAAASNPTEIQGSFYCSGPEGFAISCGAVGGAGPYRANVVGNAGGMCVAGSMTTAKDNWGATLGVNLNQASPTTVRQVYNATAHKVRGFRIETVHTPAGLPLQVKAGSITTFPENEVLPMTEFAQSGQHLVELGNLGCPYWKGTTCTNLALNSIYMLEVGLATTQVATPYDLCITKLEAMIER